MARGVSLSAAEFMARAETRNFLAIQAILGIQTGGSLDLTQARTALQMRAAYMKPAVKQPRAYPQRQLRGVLHVGRHAPSLCRITPGRHG